MFPFFARALYLIEHPQLVSRDLQSDLNERLHALELTPCEAQILRLVLSGRLYREIASNLRVHVQTVKKHMSDILAKAEVHNRYELAARLSGLQWVNKGTSELFPSPCPSSKYCSAQILTLVMLFPVPPSPLMGEGWGEGDKE